MNRKERKIMAYIDVPTSTDLVRDGMKVLTVVAATCNKTDTGAAVFTIETDGAYRIAMVGIGTAFAVVGNQIIVRASVSTANAAINNDGCYIIEAVVSANAIEVVKPVYPMTWKVYADAAAGSAALPSPAEGQFRYLRDTDDFQVFSGSAWVAAAGASVGFEQTFLLMGA